ncbi:hypothetical protein [Alishewanella longhuensis]
MQPVDENTLFDFLGQSMFSRLKYLHPDADVSDLPALIWLIEQLAPTQVLGVNLSSTSYLALCQTLEKVNKPGLQVNALNCFVDDAQGVSYHQQQYQEFSKILANQSALSSTYDFIYIATPTAAGFEKLDSCLMPNTVIALQGAVSSELEKTLSAYFERKVALSEITLFLNDVQFAHAIFLQQLPAYINKLSALFTYVESSLRERLKWLALESGFAQVEVLTQDITRLTHDKSQLERNVEQQATQIQRQQAELAALALTQQQATVLCQEYQQQLQQEQALYQQLEQQFSVVQKNHVELQQNIKLRDTELAHLTIKLEAQSADQSKHLKLLKQLAAANETVQKTQQVIKQQEQALLEVNKQVEQLKAELEQQQQAAQEQKCQYQERYNEMEKQRYLQDFTLFETQRALHNYQQEVVKLTAIIQQMSKNLENEKHRQTLLKQQVQQLKNSKVHKLLNAASRLTKPFGNNKPKQQLERQKALILSSNLFDEQWYLSQYPDVAEKKLDPVIHYLKFGGFEGRKPNAKFDSRWYIASYPDVAEQGINPLVHFIKFGQYENRATQAGE